jgi:hypothetical protein
LHQIPYRLRKRISRTAEWLLKRLTSSFVLNIELTIHSHSGEKAALPNFLNAITGYGPGFRKHLTFQHDRLRIRAIVDVKTPPIHNTCVI